MTGQPLMDRLREVIAHPLPFPGGGQSAIRHQRLAEIARENLTLARLAEAHFDALAILHEAGREPVAGALYGVWASEIPGKELIATPDGDALSITGSKRFCSGAGLIDRALLTAITPEHRLLDLDLRAQSDHVAYDTTDWKTAAFAGTSTATVTFTAAQASTAADCVGPPGFYIGRPGFWHGACGPASCWAGGALGLVDFASRQRRADPHTLAHLGAMRASGWALQAILKTAGDEIDAEPTGYRDAKIRALTVRHLVEQASTEILRRLPRAFGPHPLAMDATISRRYQELDLYLRQSHAERDLEDLART